MSTQNVQALVIGGGPAGLMAADALLRAGVSVTLADAKPSLGRKFLMAGKSGLNLTKVDSEAAFQTAFGPSWPPLQSALSEFGPKDVQNWAEGLGQEVFVGSTGRVFPKAMKASPLLRAWLAELDGLGLERQMRWRWRGWENGTCLFDTPKGQYSITPQVTVLALGGASWARLGSDGQWAQMLGDDGHALAEFAPSNAGLLMDWSTHMTAHFGAPLKNIRLTAGPASSRGEAVISAKGLEGGGVYTLTPQIRQNASLTIDFQPDVTKAAVQKRIDTASDKARFPQWLKGTLRLSPAKVALILEMTKGIPPRTEWAKAIKELPLGHAGLRPMDEAISTAGGVAWPSLTDDLMLTNRAGTFCAGEMIDWDAPTGGYLITACLATGRLAGRKAAAYLGAI